MGIFRDKANYGEVPVTVVKFKKNMRPCKDTLNYTHESIKAVIPCWKDGNVFTSVKTGEEIVVYPDDSVRTITRGTAICYEDGTEMVYSKNWRTMECSFIERGANQGATLRCFGE